MFANQYAAAPVLWPAHLVMYRRCPQQYHLKYVLRRPGRVVVQTSVTRGRVTHDVLSLAFKQFSRTRSFPANVRAEIVERLPRDEYDNADHWRAEIATIQDWFDSVVETFDRRTSVIAVESVYAYPFRGRQQEPAFTLKTRVDLVLRLEDGTVEHVDWKTGKRPWVDNIQNVAARVAIGRTLQEPRVRSTTMFLATESRRSGVLTHDEARGVWKEIKELATSISTDSDWTPIQNPLCPTCPFYLHGCSLHRGAAPTGSRQA